MTVRSLWHLLAGLLAAVALAGCHAQPAPPNQPAAVPATYAGCNPAGDDSLPPIPVSIRIVNLQDGRLSLTDGVVEAELRLAATGGETLPAHRAYFGVVGTSNSSERIDLLVDVPPDGVTLRLAIFAAAGDQVQAGLFGPSSPDPACSQWGRASDGWVVATVA